MYTYFFSFLCIQSHIPQILLKLPTLHHMLSRLVWECTFTIVTVTLRFSWGSCSAWYNSCWLANQLQWLHCPKLSFLFYPYYCSYICLGLGVILWCHDLKCAKVKATTVPIARLLTTSVCLNVVYCAHSIFS